MCYSAQIRAQYGKFVKTFGATMSLHEFFELFWRRRNEPEAKLLIPKAMEDLFAEPQSDEERAIKQAIDEFKTAEALRVEKELFDQRTRLVEAERKLEHKPTKAAAESKRIATAKIERAREWLTDLRRTQYEDRDGRFFPNVYAPVIVMVGGRRVVKPMRYQCRPAGVPAFFDKQYAGSYNARRDNLEGQFWRRLFGVSHGVVAINAFYENVARHAAEHRPLQAGEKPENVVLEFRPRPQQDMLAACLWSRWSAPGQPDLLSFALITDEPPPEVAAAGHDRCIVPIRPENVDTWLNPDPARLADAYAILDNRERPYYEHQLAA